MKKHTYRPDVKSVVERIARRMDDRQVHAETTFNIESRMGDTDWIGEPVQRILGFAELAAIVGRTVESHRLRFDPVDDRLDLYRPFLLFGGDATPVDVFVRRRDTDGVA